jgi:hypothetical protein
MARPLRIEFDGALYHVTSRGNERKAIFLKMTPFRKLFLDTLACVSLSHELFANYLGYFAFRHEGAVRFIVRA